MFRRQSNAFIPNLAPETSQRNLPNRRRNNRRSWSREAAKTERIGTDVDTACSSVITPGCFQEKTPICSNFRTARCQGVVTN
jgi:hypothetical protein